VTIEIGASIAQQARPKVRGKIEFDRAQPSIFSKLVITTFSST
jgi:hypothetical protein